MQKINHGGRSLLILAGRTQISSESMLEFAASLTKANSSVRLLDARRVFGQDHILSAFQKASRAFDNGQNVSDSLATETMLYMSGCRQIQEAVSSIGLKDDTRSVVCIADSSTEIESRLNEILIEEDELIEAGPKDISGFGITSSELATVPEDKKFEIALEHVASVDIKKK